MLAPEDKMISHNRADAMASLLRKQQLEAPETLVGRVGTVLAAR